MILGRLGEEKSMNGREGVKEMKLGVVFGEGDQIWSVCERVRTAEQVRRRGRGIKLGFWGKITKLPFNLNLFTFHFKLLP